MKYPLTKQILNIIVATQDCSKFLRSYHNFVLEEQNYDWWKETENFYNILPLPKEMNKSNACFNAVMQYDVTEPCKEIFDELPNKFEFGY